MAFLTREELKSVAPKDFVDIIVGADEEVVAEIIHEMESLIKTNLGSYYDVDLIFSKELEERDPTVMMYLKDLVYYKLMKRRKPGANINDEEYNEAMKWLEDISTGKRRANLPTIKTDTDGDGIPDTDVPFMKLGGNKRYQNGW
ncbi:phage protein Gp36 family protein [Chryseobacterium sp. TY4]